MNIAEAKLTLKVDRVLLNELTSIIYSTHPITAQLIQDQLDPDAGEICIDLTTAISAEALDTILGMARQIEGVLKGKITHDQAANAWMMLFAQADPEAFNFSATTSGLAEVKADAVVEEAMEEFEAWKESCVSTIH